MIPHVILINMQGGRVIAVVYWFGPWRVAVRTNPGGGI